MGYMVGYFSMKIWVVSVRSWGDYQSGATIGFLCKSWLNAESQVQFPFLAVDPTSVSIEFILPYWHFPEYNTISLLCFLLSTFICSLLQAPWLTQLVPFYLGRGRDEDRTWRLFLHFQGVQQQTQIFSMGSDWFPVE